MKKRWVAVFCFTVLFLVLSYRAEGTAAAVQLEFAWENAAQTVSLCNEEAQPVQLYFHTEAPVTGTLELSVRQTGKTKTVFTASADAVQIQTLYLCTLQPGENAELHVSGDTPSGVFQILQRDETDAQTETDHLLVRITLWIVFSSFLAYGLLLVAERRKKRKQSRRNQKPPV